MAGLSWRCEACGASVESGPVTGEMVALDEWRYEDWWVACTNAGCVHGVREGLSQDVPTWVRVDHG